MEAKPGDQVIVKGPRVGVPSRSGEILEVRRHPGGEHYRVQWQDQHESIFFPSSDTLIEPGTSHG